MGYAPIALFAYNRPEHLRRTVVALLNNSEATESELYVFSDAARDNKSAEQVATVRQYLRQIKGFSSVYIVERENNYGLSRSIIDGVTQICDMHGRVIVLEDDMVTSPHFLKYMNDGLTLYEKDDKVISIHGYVYPVAEELPETFFLRGSDCWGWATWQRGWSLFQPDGRKLFDEILKRNLKRTFDMEGAYPYVRMLKDQIAGKNDSWAIRWYASAFLQNRLTLFPGRSLVRNIGNDGSGTHSLASGCFSVGLADSPIRVLPQRIEESRQARNTVIRFLRKSRFYMLKYCLAEIAVLISGKRQAH